MTHEFQLPVRVEEVRPERRADALPEIAPAAPVATDDGTPLARSAAVPAVPAVPAAR
jgi:hypothetical protein